MERPVSPEDHPAHETASSVHDSVGSDRASSTTAVVEGRVDRAASLGADVLERVRARDPEALAAFFERYFDHVFGLAYRLLGDRAAAEDVTQEVFLKVHRAAPRLDASRDPAPWLTAIAVNACRDVWRSGAYRMGRRSDSIDGSADVADRLPGREGNPESLVLSREREALVRAAIDQLPEHLREAVLLYEYQGLNHQQIADALGIHHAAARKRYSRALEVLGRLLRETLGR
jgi:RNA polymerase sigma-70 factor (ECF subfamily)